MALDPSAKEAWIKVQKQHTVPVNAIGVPIKPSESLYLKIWQQEGIDKYMKK